MRRPSEGPPLWRFFVVSAALVTALGSVLFARRTIGPDLRISAKVTGSPTPSAERPEVTPAGRATPAFIGQGSWVMTSLPGCFVEQLRARGSEADVRDELPPEADRLPPATVLQRGTCTVTVGAHDIRIARGADRLRVPPEAALYRHGDRLTLVARRGNVVEVRVY